MDQIRKLRMQAGDSYIITIPMVFVRRLGWEAGTYLTFDLAPDGRSVCVSRVPEAASEPGYVESPPPQYEDAAAQPPMYNEDDSVHEQAAPEPGEYSGQPYEQQQPPYAEPPEAPEAREPHMYAEPPVATPPPLEEAPEARDSVDAPAGEPDGAGESEGADEPDEPDVSSQDNDDYVPRARFVSYPEPEEPDDAGNAGRE